MKPIHVAVLAAAGLLAAALAGVGSPDAARSDSRDARRVTVTGRGTVESVPSEASFSFGVQSRGSTAASALHANAGEMRRVLAALRAAGVDAKDLRTQQVSLSPQLDESGRSVVGYSASNTVTARIRTIGRSGSVIDAAVAAGANDVYGPSLEQAERDDLYERALRGAVADARSKARELADATGSSLGPVVTVAETSSPSPAPYAYSARLAADQATPVEPGTEEISATVTVTFELR